MRIGGALVILCTSCEDTLIGTPCIPATEESSPTFTGYIEQEAVIDTSSDNLHVCLVNHFRGLTTCPFGQNASGDGVPLADGGTAPFPDRGGPCRDSHGDLVVGAVQPQCTDRLAKNVVVWSCLCANAEGKTDDGREFCSCPSKTRCEPLIPPNGDAVDTPSDAYCIPIGSEYAFSGTCATSCDPTMTSCD